MALTPLTPALTASATPPRSSPGPYKRRTPSPEFTAHLPAHTSLSPRMSHSLTERRRLPALHHRRPPSSTPSSPGEALIELSVPPSPFCAPAGELWRTRAAGGRALVSALPCPLSAPASVDGGPSTPGRSTETWTRSMNYPLGNNSLFRLFKKSWKEVPGLLGNQPAVQILPILHSGPRVFLKLTRGPRFLQFDPKSENNYKKVPSLRKINKNSYKIPKIHIFPTTTPNLVILVPKFLESLPLSIYAFI
jgi:hypothetical protein